MISFQFPMFSNYHPMAPHGNLFESIPIMFRHPFFAPMPSFRPECPFCSVNSVMHINITYLGVFLVCYLYRFAGFDQRVDMTCVTCGAVDVLPPGHMVSSLLSCMCVECVIASICMFLSYWRDFVFVSSDLV